MLSCDILCLHPQRWIVSSRLLRTHEIVSGKSNAFIIMQQVQQARFGQNP